ncbi:hypothetical protein LTR10_021105 [Elasticomyces elasticus]|uniref:Uncharacterized protein n=1 Tax=Exophiala sideris TaxID=1016849 RepID=A0ABR0J6H3_9EURO|nr:hypothetical protein LTR10_021105 [Elasticomyces elasticus]KAK5028902.1 hypothetical protein LTS07_006283 [Exophiala sideris]KAK5035771.1 hypothetical protein LTR13_005902 [Exophiala sideris]KAK5057406.1 hypothetical protein LTR69_007447 [Exophiala sideris]KAK5181618.1 hypothetical protein LTR44_005817 [Eurotiomycetes sp. CCFEE 6388]
MNHDTSLSGTAATHHGVTTTLDELKVNQHVSFRKARDAYWVGVAPIIIMATQYAGFEKYIRSEFFEKPLKAAIENSSGLNGIQTCNYETMRCLEATMRIPGSNLLQGRVKQASTFLSSRQVQRSE